jgi:tRNA A-37 threonylcarbamoyl transferase component Bud32
VSLLDDPETWLKVLQEERPCGLSFLGILGSGRSAVVFKAVDLDGATIAVKIYDAQRLVRFGQDIQRERIDRELSLRGHSCSNLVQIHDGGILSVGEQQFPFVSLEYIDGRDLRERVNSGRISDADIRSCLRCLFRAADFLDERGLCHRDIKVDNCRLRTSGELVLLDLGVLRPIEASDLTDDVDDPKTKWFLGTLRYAPPELLLRKEGPDANSWRAISIYQIGAVLYELIHGVQLFPHIREPYAELVLSVLHTTPTVMRQDVGQDLLTLTRNCLVKDPNERIQLVSWSSLLEVANADAAEIPSIVDLSDQLRRAADQYQNTVAAKRRQKANLEERQSQTLLLAERCAIDALALPELAALKVAPISIPDAWTWGKTVVLAVPQSLEYRFPTRLWICLRIKLQEAAVEAIHIDGLGVYGDLPKAELDELRPEWGQHERLRVVLHAARFRGLYESIIEEPPDVAAHVPRLREWAARLVTRYWKLTDDAWKQRLTQVSIDIERPGPPPWVSTSRPRTMPRRSPWSSSPTDRLYVLNSTQIVDVHPSELTV